MRTLAFAFVFAAGACSAVDDFSRFQFGGSGDDGGGVTHDLAVSGGSDGGKADLAPPPPAGPDMALPPPGFGEPCDVDCASPYTCSHLGSKDTMGICSRSCTTANNSVCLALGASCVTVESTTLCMPNCSPTQACRSDLTCCANAKTSVVGQCAPAATDFCGKG